MHLRVLAGCCAFAVGVVFATHGRNADAATSDLAYDEIVKFAVIATPPPPGSFAADYAAISAPTKTQNVQPKGHGLFGAIDLRSLAHSAVNGNPGDVAKGAASATLAGSKDAALDTLLDAALRPMASAFAGLQNGVLERHAFYHGWERSDDDAAKTATILRCDRHERITLDLARKTYRIDDPTSVAPSASRASAATLQRGCNAGADSGPPGTGVLEISTQGSALGTLPFDGVAAAGYSTTNTMAIKNGTGSCRNGSFGVTETAYYAPYPVPRAYCPLPQRARYPQTPAEMMSARGGGCQLKPSLHASGPARPSNRLALYELMTMTGGEAAGTQHNGMSFVIERGNVRQLGAGDASLFEVPADFSKAH